MHAISRLLIEYDTTPYALQKDFGMSQPSLSRSINNNSSITNMKGSTYVQFANALNEPPEIIFKKLLQYEEEEKMKEKQLSTLVHLEGIYNVKPARNEDLETIIELLDDDIDFKIEDGMVFNEAGTYVADVVEIIDPNINPDYLEK